MWNNYWVGTLTDEFVGTPSFVGFPNEVRVEWYEPYSIGEIVIKVPCWRIYKRTCEQHGYWSYELFSSEYYSDKIYHYEFKVIKDTGKEYSSEEFTEWVEEIIDISPTHGTITIIKEPTYIFTKWHKLNDSTTPAGMDLNISYECEQDGVINRKIAYIMVKMVVVRYQEMGEDEYLIYEGYGEGSDLIVNNYEYGSVESVLSLNGSSGIINSHFEFGHAGTNESTLYIEMLTEEGSLIEITAPIPINGYFGINISEPAGPVDNIFKKSKEDVGTINF